jgi:CBS domain containing-hemolysin-like protein
MSLVLSLLAVPFLIGACAFFVVAEYALVAVRSGQIEQIRQRRPRAAAALRHLKHNMSSTIGTLQICLTVCNLILGWVGEPAMTEVLVRAFGTIAKHGVFRGATVMVSFIVITLLTVVLSELVPKALTLQHTLLAARLIAQPVAALQVILKPLVWVMEKMANATTRLLGLGVVSIESQTVTAEEFRHIASEAAESGSLTTRERSLILNSLTLGRRTAAEVMVPRVRVSYLDIQRSMPDNLAAISSYLFSRMPLCDGGMDHVIGVVYTKEFLTASAETDDSSVLLLIARPPVFTPVTIPLDRLLTRFHDDKSHLMFLVDEHGSVKGIVTLTDVVNELLGPMHEGHDARIIARTADGLIVKGDMPIGHVAEHINRPGWGSDADVRSIGGLMTARLGRVAHAGDSVEIGDVKLVAHKSNGRSVEEVQIIAPPVADSAALVPHENR